MSHLDCIRGLDHFGNSSTRMPPGVLRYKFLTISWEFINIHRHYIFDLNNIIKNDGSNFSSRGRIGMSPKGRKNQLILVWVLCIEDLRHRIK